MARGGEVGGVKSRSRPRHGAADHATDREVSVVAAVLSAGSEKAAAYRLGLAHSTVKHHLANARSKVGATTTAQLVWILGPRLPDPEQTAHGDNDGRRAAGGAEARRVPERGVPQHVIPVGMGREARDDHLARRAEVVPEARQLRGGDPGNRRPARRPGRGRRPVRFRCSSVRWTKTPSATGVSTRSLPAGARAELDEQLVQLVERLGRPARRPRRDRGVECLL